MIGATLSHFKITAKLGEGGMGEVYRAEDTKLGREVAIKVLPAEMADDPERLERFQREARVLAALNHPNIVSVYSVESAVVGAPLAGAQEGTSPSPTRRIQFLVMGLVEGEPLGSSIPAGGMPIKEIFRRALPLVEAVAAAHEKGIVHRDLKPGNIIVNEEGRLMVLDFGLAKLTEPEAVPETSELDTEALTQRGVILGTVPYMSPEQIEGKSVDQRTDIFSLGVLLYEMTTSKRPFQGDSSPALMSSILKDTPQAVAESRPDLPRHLGRIVNRCLEKDPEDRFQSAKDLLADLRHLEREIASQATTVSTVVEPPRRPRSRALALGLVAVAILLTAISAVMLYPRAAPDRIDSLAVLPFENASGDPDAEYFSDGVTETIISSLSQLPDMKVISRTSAFHYKGQEIDPPRVGEDLGVEALVLGRIVQRGDELMVSAELVRTRDSGQIWGQQFQRQAADIFSIQKEIASEISTALQVELTTAQEERLTKQHTEDSAAYLAYLKGRHAWNLRTEAGFREAIEHFEEAIDADPTYALAYSGLADCYGLLGYYSAPPHEVYPKARAAVERALELDETLAEAHTSLAWIFQMYDWEFAAAQREYERAIELNPSYATAHHWYATSFSNRGQADLGVEQLRKAVELDPLSRIINIEYATWLGFAGYYREAEEQYQRSRSLDPDFPHLYLRYGWVLEHQGRFAEAVELYERGVELMGAAYGLGQLGHAYAKVGRVDEARAILTRLEELSRGRFVSPIEPAYIYSGLGELDRAFELLEQAYELRIGDLAIFEMRFGADLGDDPRYDDLKRRIGLP